MSNLFTVYVIMLPTLLIPLSFFCFLIFFYSKPEKLCIVVAVVVHNYVHVTCMAFLNILCTHTHTQDIHPPVHRLLSADYVVSCSRPRNRDGVSIYTEAFT